MKVLLPEGVVDLEQINAELERVNDLIASFYPFRFAAVPPELPIPADINAHFMEKRTFEQLKNNIKRDGNLSQLPFCWKDSEGVFHILSGHHRIGAAVDAGVPVTIVIYTNAELTMEQRTAIQISHNTLVGEDDLDILKQQFATIKTMDAKFYTGLDDNYFDKFTPIEIKPYSDRDLLYQTIEMAFLPSEIDVLKDAIERIKNTQRQRFAGVREQYEPFTLALMRFKDVTRIFNSATAFQLLIEIAEKYCDWLESQAADEVTPEGWQEIQDSLQDGDLISIDLREQHFGSDAHKRPKK